MSRFAARECGRGIQCPNLLSAGFLEDELAVHLFSSVPYWLYEQERVSNGRQRRKSARCTGDDRVGSI